MSTTALPAYSDALGSSHGEGEVGTSLDDAWLRGETLAAADFIVTGSPSEQGSAFIHSVGNRDISFSFGFIESSGQQG